MEKQILEYMDRQAVRAPNAINEAYNYDKPSSFSRAITFNLENHKVFLLSGTASVGADGETEFPNDFALQTTKMFYNVTELLFKEDMSWRDVVRTTYYLRDIARDYEQFNVLRTQHYENVDIGILPASTGIQAILCREDLLIEMEAIAIAKIVK